MNTEDKYRILVEALKEIAIMAGPFKIDRLAHAESVIEYNKGVAVEALKKVGESVD